jgi:hypothetical protein
VVAGAQAGENKEGMIKVNNSQFSMSADQPCPLFPVWLVRAPKHTHTYTRDCVFVLGVGKREAAVAVLCACCWLGAFALSHVNKDWGILTRQWRQFMGQCT